MMQWDNNHDAMRQILFVVLHHLSIACLEADLCSPPGSLQDRCKLPPFSHTMVTHSLYWCDVTMVDPPRQHMVTVPQGTMGIPLFIFVALLGCIAGQPLSYK